MNVIIFEALLVFLLILANGVFAMSEMAVVSARKSRLQQMADKGDLSAVTALDLATNPDRLLSTVQIGITLIGILAGAFGGATIAEQLGVKIDQIPALAGYGNAVGLALVVIVITYLSLIVGELVPKRLALANPERIAALMARPMRLLSKLATPLVAFLSISTNAVFKILGIRPSDEPPVTEEEIKILIDEGTRAGVFEETEQDLVERVFRLGDRRVSALMTPRPDIFWLDLDSPEVEIVSQIARSQYSRFPVCRGTIDGIVGTLKAKEYLAAKIGDPDVSIKQFVREPLFVPETSSAFQVLEMFKSARNHLAFVVDEYGVIEGLVTTNDFLEAIAGGAAHKNAEEKMVTEREDGSFLVDAAMPIDEFADFFDIEIDLEGEFQTLAGYILALLGYIPAVAEKIPACGLTLEIMDLDGRRIDRVLVTRSAASEDVT